MDHPPAPPPYSRPLDRPPAHDTNHLRSTSQTFAAFAPPALQQPFHAPFAANPPPAQRRDPFMPSGSHHARHRSEGGILRDKAAPIAGDRVGDADYTGSSLARPSHGPIHYAALHHAQRGPPLPPSMSAAAIPSAPSPYGFDAARRRSLNGATPPTPYGVTSHDPPPPPSFARPQMPPPSSPTQQPPPQHLSHASQPPRLPQPPSFGGTRELPGLGAPRLGGSMSISSLIGGGDTSAPGHTSQSQSSPPISASHSMQPPSPRHAPPSSTRPDFAPFRRQQSPERSITRPIDAHTTATSPSHSYSNQGSPMQGQPSFKPLPFSGQRLFSASPSEAHGRDNRPLSAHMPPRPNSQPIGAPGSLVQDGRHPYDGAEGRRNMYGAPEERRRTLGESHHARPNAAELLSGASRTPTNRDRPNTVNPVSQAPFSPPRDRHLTTAPTEPPRALWRQTPSADVPRESVDVRKEEPAQPQRPYGPYPSPLHSAPRINSIGPENMARGHSVDQLNHRVVEQYQPPPTSDPASLDRHRTEPLSRSISSGGRSLYDHPRRMGEDMQYSKSHIGFGLDANRRTGRASPLPQAVQGAQAQPISIGKDPGIKSEFGRMFSGLGSGLGSSTPSRGSPMPQNGTESFDSVDSLRLQRVNSQSGRKPKRSKDDEGGFDVDNADGRGMPSSLRAVKRNKYTHQSHHHHHPAHHHHHHHHHHHTKAEDEASAPNTSLNGKSATLSQASPAPAVHHHHHIQGTPHHHHHHHAPRATAQQPVIAMKLPLKVHDIQPILDEAAKHRRRHLGSHVYETSTELPRPSSSLDDQFGYASKSKRLPRFAVNPINCTFTIRVPRFYLQPRQRQHIVLGRQLWGARVYRDDTDPIAAAIHSGWIRGEWDDTIDVAMLDPRITAPNNPTDAEVSLTKPPAAPVTPPADMDLQIEILILPQLQAYHGTVEYGISSRKGKGHEGLSFMINKIRWVEEGIGSRGHDRTAAALKRRLDASATLLALKGGDDPMRVNGTTKLHA